MYHEVWMLSHYTLRIDKHGSMDASTLAFNLTIGYKIKVLLGVVLAYIYTHWSVPFVRSGKSSPCYNCIMNV